MSLDEMYRSIRFLPKNLAKKLAEVESKQEEGGITYKKAKKASKKTAKKKK